MQRDIEHNHRGVMIRSLMAAGVGVAGKILGLFNQIASVVLISGALGADGLREQMLAIAFVSWFNLTLCGMHTSLPVLLVRSAPAAEASQLLIKTAFILAVLGALVSVALTLLILNLKLTNSLVGAPLATAIICNAITIVFGLSEKVFHGTDRIAQFNVLNMIGTLVSLGTTFILAKTYPSASGFVIAFYLGVLLPPLAATVQFVPLLDLMKLPSLTEFCASARQLIGVGVFGLGYEVASYCKLQAPLALLALLDLSSAIAPVGLGLRLLGLISGGLTIAIPILMLQIGTAIRTQDEGSRRFWTRTGLGIAAVTAVVIVALYPLVGPAIFQAWTAGSVALGPGQPIALAVFSAIFLVQNLVFPLIAPDPSFATQLRWLFWLEGPAVIVAAVVSALLAPANYGGAALLGGAAFVMGIVSLILLTLLVGRRFSDSRGNVLRLQKHS